MKLLLNSLKTAYGYAIEMSQRKRTLAYLQTLNERNLLDKGFAPHLISGGLAGYPWTVVKEELSPIHITVSKTAEKAVAAETTEFRTAA